MIVETVFEELAAFESLRDRKIKAVGELKEGTEDVYAISDESKEALIQELNELMAEKITILCDKIPEQDLPDDFRISPAEVGSFYAFVEPVE